MRNTGSVTAPTHSASWSPPASPVERPCLPLGIYIHWPFCRSKCPYCDFNSHVVETVDQDRWRRALVVEIDRHREMTEGQVVGSVYFGGGTPSLMPPATVAAVLDAVHRAWPVTGDLETTLEANPTSVETGRLTDFRSAGINRVSLGVQALDDRALAALGRHHSVAEARQAVDAAAAIYDRFSFDLIYGRPGQTPDAWRAELQDAVTMARDHVSAYELTIEPGTAYFRDGVAGPDEDTGAALYAVTQEVLCGAGMPAYEISNHARPGGECRHNLAVWRGGDYVGIGPGAHGRVGVDGRTYATRGLGAPEKWLIGVEQAGHGDASATFITLSERAEELVLLGLRLTDGIDLHRFRTLTGRDLVEVLDHDSLARLIDAGAVQLDQDRLRATTDGRQRLDWVLRCLLA